MNLKELTFEEHKYSDNSIRIKIYVGNMYLFSVETGDYEKYYYLLFNGHIPSVIVSYLPERDIRIAPLINRFNSIEEAKEVSKEVVKKYINYFVK